MTSKEYIREIFYGIYCYRDPEMTVHHRERGLPSVEYSDGNKEYWENDQWHRLDGLAFDGSYYKFHYLNGKRIFGETI